VGKEMQASISQLHLQLNKIEELIIQHHENTFTGEEMLDAITKLTQAVIRIEGRLLGQNGSTPKGINSSTADGTKDSVISPLANRKSTGSNKRARLSDSSTSTSAPEPGDVVIGEGAASTQGATEFATHREACQSVKIEELEEENKKLSNRVKLLEADVRAQTNTILKLRSLPHPGAAGP
jgi:hypothetical protein